MERINVISGVFVLDDGALMNFLLANYLNQVTIVKCVSVYYISFLEMCHDESVVLVQVRSIV